MKRFGALLLATAVVSSVPMLTAWADKLIFFPEVLPDDAPMSFAVPTEEVRLKRPDGAVIHGLWFSPPETVRVQPRVVLYFHGNAGSLRSWGEVGAEFAAQGLTVFMIDYRGFGKSTGQRSEALLFEDGLAAFDHVRERMGERDIVIYGRSIGSGIASYVAAQRNPAKVLLETPFVDFADVANAHFPFLPVRTLSPYQFDNAGHLATVTAPVHIFHGTADEVVPYSSGQKLHDRLAAAGRTVTLTTVEGGQHNSLSSHQAFRTAQRTALGLAAP